MGEAKRKRDRMTDAERIAHAVTRQIANEGKVIGAGAAAFLLVHKIAADDPRAAIVGEAFMAGAEHLFSSIMSLLDPGEEPTVADLARMDNIAAEIDAWRVKQGARSIYEGSKP